MSNAPVGDDDNGEISKTRLQKSRYRLPQLPQMRDDCPLCRSSEKFPAARAGACSAWTNNPGRANRRPLERVRCFRGPKSRAPTSRSTPALRPSGKRFAAVWRSGWPGLTIADESTPQTLLTLARAPRKRLAKVARRLPSTERPKNLRTNKQK
jgi:hypothetical protein